MKEKENVVSAGLELGNPKIESERFTKNIYKVKFSRDNDVFLWFCTNFRRYMSVNIDVDSGPPDQSGLIQIQCPM